VSSPRSSAATLVADPPWDDYYGPGSALERLVARDGKVLRLGADPDTVTLLHYAEYLCALPDKRRVRRYRRVTAPDGPTIRVVACLDDEHGIVEHPGEDYFASILGAYLAEGRARTGVVGSAASELIDARDVVAFAVRWMNAHLGRR
jgi:aminoglycoside N3'-acetyltransferase